MEKKDITNTELLTAIRENGQAIQKNTRTLQENNILTKGLIEQVAKNAVGIAMLESNIAQLPELGVPLAMEPFCTVKQAYSHFEPFQAVFDQSPSLAKTNPGILIQPGIPLNESEKDVFSACRTILYRY